MSVNYYFSSEVQCGHLVASNGISLQQNGHFLVVIVTGASSLVFNLLIALMSKNTQNATIKKLMTAFKNNPKFKVVAPAAWAASIVA